MSTPLTKPYEDWISVAEKPPPLPIPAYPSIYAGLHPNQVQAGFTAEQMTAYGQASRKQALQDAAFELEGMTCNNATARSAIKLCIETIKEMK